MAKIKPNFDGIPMETFIAFGDWDRKSIKWDTALLNKMQLQFLQFQTKNLENDLCNTINKFKHDKDLSKMLEMNNLAIFIWNGQNDVGCTVLPIESYDIPTFKKYINDVFEKQPNQRLMTLIMELKIKLTSYAYK